MTQCPSPSLWSGGSRRYSPSPRPSATTGVRSPVSSSPDTETQIRRLRDSKLMKNKTLSVSMGFKWTRMLEFAVEFPPAPEPRPRASGSRIYVPPSADEWKDEVRAEAKYALLTSGDESLPSPDTPIAAFAEFRMPRPKSHYRTGRNAHLLKDSAPLFPLSTPDLDNLIKATWDALGPWAKLPGLCWDDDSLVLWTQDAKLYEDGQKRNGARIVILHLCPEDLRMRARNGLLGIETEHDQW